MENHTKRIKVEAIWDSEAELWVAESKDLPGLVVEAATHKELAQKICDLVPDLIELNGHLMDPELLRGMAPLSIVSTMELCPNKSA